MVKITMNVEGMMCGHCEAHVNDAIRVHLILKVFLHRTERMKLS